MLIAAEKITKQYGDSPLLDGCSLYINEYDKIGVIGRNGAGKTTLLRLIAGVENPDSGVVTQHGKLRLGYLPQTPLLQDGYTILQQVLESAGELNIEAQEYEAKRILGKLGIHDTDVPVQNLSGGQKKRVALAAVLVSHCELLILDEPTNHLDDRMIRWLEQYLQRFSGAVLMVTHDRYFLDRVVARIVEVDRGALYLYDGGYTEYLKLRAQRYEMEAGTERKRQSLLRKELAWMQQGPKARGTKSRSRIERYEALSEQAAPDIAVKLELGSISTRLGKKIVELNGISKSYGDKLLFKDFDHIIARDARIGVVGPNGCGKSTLLQVIANRVAPDSGSVSIGETVKIGYLTQECGDMNPNMRVIDYVKEYGETIETKDGPVSATQLLEQFLFPADLQWNSISRLSGGERRRLFLMGILISAPNVLLLDEPTNDLDIDTLMVLEDYVEIFPGAVIVVSHDRYFLDKTTDFILEFQEGGHIEEYLGGYSGYLNSVEAASVESAAAVSKKETPPAQKERAARPQKTRFSFKEQREYEEIDDVLAALEAKKAALEVQIEQASSDYIELQRLMELQTEIEEQLEEKALRWLYLQELAEQIEREKTEQ